jgi:hypothetical protein
MDSTPIFSGVGGSLAGLGATGAWVAQLITPRAMLAQRRK